ncbi:MAG: restriction endonuclease subunit S, partial [Prevotella sp.]|nr:restriction endonuclease subunit S [Prevotella sp.]
MTAKQLTDSILQLAIQGKLVPQDPNDEPASVLLERIREEKRRLLEEKKIKADKNESHIYLSDDGHWMEHFVIKKTEDICIDDEIPFNVPCGWGLCRIDEYVCKVTDFVASGSFASLRENVKYYSNKEYAILVRTKDFQTNFETDLVYTDKHGYEFLSNSNLYGGELILPNIGASIGKVFIVPTLSYRMTLAPNTVMVRFYWDEQRDWLYTLFCSRYGKNLLKDISSSTAQGKFNKTDFKRLLIPIPPLAEQHRIVERIEEILPFVKEYGEAYEEATKMDNELPEKLKKSILQDAIMGKLGTQDPNDEPASVLLEKIRAEKKKLVKEGVLKKKDLLEAPIAGDEKPFKIPENWKWHRLGMVTYMYTGNSISESEKSAKYTNVDGLNYIGTKDVQFDHSIDYDNGIRIPLSYHDKFTKAPSGSILLC